MNRTLLGIFLLVLVCCTAAVPYYETYCLDFNGEGGGEGLGEGEGIGEGEAGTEVPDIFRTGLISPEDAYYSAWSMMNPYSPGCGHLATYRNEDEFVAIVESMLRAGATASLIAADRISGGDGTFVWGAGGLRGQNFLFIGEDYANCFQDFCLPEQEPPNLDILPITDSAAQIGMNMVVYYIGSQLVVELVPASGSYCFTVEFPEVATVADVNGFPGYTLHPVKLPYFQMEETFIQQGGFINRISSAKQNQWLLDEFQCGSFNIWLGYYAEQDILRCASGPDDGTIIAVSGDQTCDVYCNFEGSQLFEEDEAVFIDTDTGFWKLRDRSNRYWALKQTEVCPAQQVGGLSAVCVPGTTDNWYQVVATADAEAMIEAGTAFQPGGPFFFHTDYDDFALYFDCQCNTDYRINLSCLGSSDIANCILQGTSDISSQNSSFSTHSSLQQTSELPR